MGEYFDTQLLFKSSQRQRGRPQRDASDVLRAKIVWTAWSIAEGGENALRARYLMRRRGHAQDDLLAMRSDEISNYRQGRRTLSLSRQRLLVSKHPAIEHVLNWPLKLLNLRSMSLREVQACNYLYADTKVRSLARRYVFPEQDDLPCAESRINSIFHTESLYERGDAYGFLAILGAFRLFHLQHEPDAQWDAGRDLMRALPGFCRDPRVRPHTEEVIHLTKSLLQLLPDKSVPLSVDDTLLWQQINSDLYEPCWAVRRIVRSAGFLIPEPIDPVISYTFRRCHPDRAPLFRAGDT